MSVWCSEGIWQFYLTPTASLGEGHQTELRYAEKVIHVAKNTSFRTS